MATPLFISIFAIYQPAFLKATIYPKKITSLLDGLGLAISGKSIKATHLHR